MSGTGTIVREKDVHWIVKILRESPTLIRDAERFCGALGIHGADLELFRMSSRGPHEFLHWALRTWILEAGDNATHENLVTILKGENFNRVAQRLVEESRLRGQTQTGNLLETQTLGTIVTEWDVYPIVKVLEEAPGLIRDAERFCGALGIHGTDLELFRMSRREPQELLPWALRTWISEAGDNATLENLVTILKGENYNRVAQRLDEELRRRGQSQIGNSLETVGVWFEVPGPFLHFAGRANYLRKLHKSIMEQTKDYITVITTRTTTLVSGLGGIGKTTLAIHYAWTFQKSGFYSNVVWINGETFTAMKASLSRLADHLNVNTFGKNPQDIEATKLMELIYERFRGQQNTLFIFDNVDDYESIKQYLPVIKPKVRNPFVLLTSRKRILNDKVDRTELDVFEEKESVEFFTKYLALKTEKEKSYSKLISTMLHHLPLAIRQAGAYIRTQKENSKTSNKKEMREYIDQFKENSKKLLGYDSRSRTNDIYEQTTLTTWNVTMNKIKEQNQLSVDLMNLMAYLTPDNIPIFFLVYIDDEYFSHRLRRLEITSYIVMNKNKLKLRLEVIKNAISLLSDYSMIVRQDKNMSVHRLVQHVIREEQADQAYLDDCVKLISVYLADKSNDDKSCVLQGESVVAYIKKSGCQDRYEEFIQLIEEKLNSAVEEQIQLVRKLFTDGLIEEAIQFNQECRDGWNKSSSNYKLYLEKSVNLLCELSYSQNQKADKIIADEIMVSMKGNDELVVDFLVPGPSGKLFELIHLNYKSEFEQMMQTAFTKLRTNSKEGSLWKTTEFYITYCFVYYLYHGFRILLKADECVEVLLIFNSYFTDNDTPSHKSHFTYLDSIRRAIVPSVDELNGKLVPELFNLSIGTYDIFATDKISAKSPMSHVASTVIYCLTKMKREDEILGFVQKHLTCTENACRQIPGNHNAILGLLEFSERLLTDGREGQIIQSSTLVQGSKLAIEKFYTISHVHFNDEYSNSLRALRVITNARLLLKIRVRIDVMIFLNALIPKSSASKDQVAKDQRIFLDIMDDLIAFNFHGEALVNLELLEECIIKHSDLSDMSILIATMRLASKIKTERGYLKDALVKLREASRMLVENPSYGPMSEMNLILEKEIQEIQEKEDMKATPSDIEVVTTPTHPRKTPCCLIL